MLGSHESCLLASLVPLSFYTLGHPHEIVHQDDNLMGWRLVGPSKVIFLKRNTCFLWRENFGEMNDLVGVAHTAMGWTGGKIGEVYELVKDGLYNDGLDRYLPETWISF